jgi:hypothetical protein
MDPPRFHIGHGTMQVDVHLSCQLLLTTVFVMNRMGWLTLTYVSDPNIIFLTPTDDI